ncbi:MAG: GAF domain-containing protein [Candidatus Rokubacteria bacterium]|nr:GAF domain-containing protein [Candidatus Rokubacteria bacterium]
MINVNKLFPRLSIRAKLVIAFCLFGVIPLALVGGYGVVHAFLLLHDAAQDRLKTEIVMKTEEIQRYLGGVREDTLFLSRLPALHALINLPRESTREGRRSLVIRLGEELLSFSRFHQAYSQVSYIDESGREVVRANFDGNRHYLVPSPRLQDKRDRYFREAMAIPAGTIYVSPMDLNVEWGAVEVPHKPVVRFAVPLRSARDEPRGIVLIHLHASHILRQILALGQEGWDVSLANSAGFYLSRYEWIRARPDFPGSGDPPFASWLAFGSERLQSGQEFGSQGLSEQLSEDFPLSIVSTILSGNAGTLVEPAFHGRIVAFAPIFPQQERQGAFWVVVHSYSKAEIFSSVRSLQLVVLVLGGGVLVIALVLGVAAARHFTRPITALIRGAEAIAQGEFDRPIRVETNDELEDLSRQFTRMASHLKEHERQLREARERAERKAQETQALSRIGMEVLALLSLPQILQLVVDKARELLKGELAIVCLSESDGGLRLGALSGATGALQLTPGDPVPALTCAKVLSQEAPCPAIVAPPFPSHVAVVMRSGDRVIGHLCVASREPRPMRPDELEFLSGLANQATIAIENARLHREVRELARLEERERIGQDIHDGIIQSIYATGLGLEECARLVDEAPEDAKRRLEQLMEGLDGVIRDVRNYIVGLPPERLQERDLSQALADLARGLSLNALLHLDLSLEPGIDRTLAPEQVGHLFHIGREALTNVLKHAGASRVVVSLRRAAGVLRLSVEDDGAGFDPARRSTAGQGLRNMRERAWRLRGSLSVESAPGRGTRVIVEVPPGKMT